MNIDNLSLTELKAIAYDQVGVLEQTRNNLQILNRRIAELSEAEDRVKAENKAKAEAAKKAE